MNKVHSKHYSLLLQEDIDSCDSISEYDEKMMILEEEEEDEGFNAMIGGDDHDDYDDESDEEEIYSSNQHRQLSNEGLAINGQSCYGRKNDYRLLTNSEMGPKGNSYDVPLSAIWTPTPMSPQRRVCFLASIMFGVLVMAMFLWALPCDVEPCEGSLKHTSKQWLTQLDNIAINYTYLLHLSNEERAVIFGYYAVSNMSEVFSINETADISCEYDLSSNEEDPCNFKEKFFDSSSTTCGLMLLSEDSGVNRWRTDLYECPSHIKCDLLDVTGDGIPDCLVLGHSSMALMLEPKMGLIFWHLHTHATDEDINVHEFHFDVPLVIQDLNDDTFSELLFPAVELVSQSHLDNPSTSGLSHLILVSGRTGEVIGKPYLLSQCQEIREIFSEGDSIGYSCSMENGSDLAGSIPLSNLFDEIMGGPMDVNGHLRNESIMVLQERVPLPDMNEGVCQIKYVNKGKCPYCRAKLQLGLSSDNPIFDDNEYKSVVSWKVLTLGTACKGAVLKLWKWNRRTLREPFVSEGVSDHLRNSRDSINENSLEFNPNEPLKAKPSLDYNSYENIDQNSPEETLLDDLDPFKDNFYSTRHNKHSRKNSESIPSSHVPPSKNFEYPLSHKYPGKQTSSNLDNLNSGPGPEKATSNLLKNKLFTKLAKGLRLQEIEEVIVLLIFNGSDWVSKELGSLVINQLCQETCLPSHTSQGNSLIIDRESLVGKSWNIYVTSSTLKEKKDPYRNDTSSILMETYIKKIVTEVVF